MEKISSKEAIASKLKQKEEEINQRIEALQNEVSSTGSDVKHYLKTNPWVGLAGSVIAGVVVGLIVGGKSEKTRKKEKFDAYADQLSEAMGEAGVNTAEINTLLKEAIRSAADAPVYAPPQKKKSALSGKLFNVAVNMALGFAQKSLINFLDEKVAASTGSDLEKKADSEN